MVHGTRCWAQKHKHKFNIAKMRMLCWMSEHIRQDRIRNECTSDKVRVAPIQEKMVESRFKWWSLEEKTIRSPSKKSTSSEA